MPPSPGDTPSDPAEPPPIRLRGVRQNNLRGVDVNIPYDAVTVVTGVSGSGKTSLVLDTLYAEGQRRYVETFSSRARQFLERMPRPRAESVDGLPPAVAVRQGNPVRTSRSTVGTTTDLTDHLELVFARAGSLSCGGCGNPVRAESPTTVADAVEALDPGTAVVLGFALPPAGTLPWGEQAAALRARGFLRVIAPADARARPTDALETRPDGELYVVVDRVVAGKTARARVLDSAAQALRHGKGRAHLLVPGASPAAVSDRLHCAACDVAYRPPRPALFSFDSPLGACPTCRGFGRTIDLDPRAVIPDHDLTLAGGAVRPWTTRRTRSERAALARWAERSGCPVDVPWRELRDEQQHGVLEGDDEFHGVRGWMRWLESKSYKMRVRVILARYRRYVTCDTCHGTRRRDEPLLWRIGGRNVHEWETLSVADARAAADSLVEQTSRDSPVALVLDGLRSRLAFLQDVGLGYITLDRATRTLSGGEFQRVHLAAALGASLVDTLYVLDEPTTGLHPADTGRLLDVVRRLRDRGNTVVVVEHDEETIRAADHVVDVGPGAGAAGGRVLYQGPLDGLLDVESSATARALAGGGAASRDREPREPTGTLVLRGARGHNLKDVDLELPLGCLTAVVGVSGSGKSSLVTHTLHPALLEHLGESGPAPLLHDGVDGAHAVGRVVLVDQTPIGRTPRSNPATYCGAMLRIRTLFASTDAAKRLRLTAKRFSFNDRRGRCHACEGAGVEVVDMQFLADVSVPCEECRGMRFKADVLVPRFRGRNVHEVLQLSVDDALAFLHPSAAQPGESASIAAAAAKAVAALAPLSEVGLGYLPIGQPGTTLSGGEAQRLKLATQLSHARTRRGGRGRRSLLVLDEPTTGLHMADVDTLIACLGRLADAGHTLVVVEHHMGVVAVADHVVELGPGGGSAGGRVVASGTPDDVARGSTPTAPFLARALRTGAEEAAR